MFFFFSNAVRSPVPVSRAAIRYLYCLPNEKKQKKHKRMIHFLVEQKKWFRTKLVWAALTLFACFALSSFDHFVFFFRSLEKVQFLRAYKITRT